ncbi:MAG TPA: hypothetical protein PK222_06715, partial [Bacteroidales bacterium]|nr:hypothetical protein [Bacteroidales bacterium]
MVNKFIKTSTILIKLGNKKYKIVKILFFTIFTLFLSNNAISQDVQFSGSFFPNSPGLKEAKKNIKMGNSLFIKGEGYYNEALDYYLKANLFNPDNAELNYKIGICYLYTADKDKALEHLEKAYNLKSDVAEDITYYLGMAYHQNLNFDQAINYYRKYLDVLNPRNKAKYLNDINKKIEECKNGKEIVKDKAKVIIDNLGETVNSIYPDYAPVISADESMLIFTSRRPTNIGGLRDPMNGKFFEDIYIAYLE